MKAGIPIPDDEATRPRKKRVFRWILPGVLSVLILTILVFLILIPHRMSAARKAGAVANLNNLCMVIEVFHQDTGRYPTTAEGLDALVTCPADLLATWHGPYIDKIPSDKWGHEYRYCFPSGTDPTTFELHDVGPDGIDGTADDVSGDSK